MAAALFSRLGLVTGEHAPEDVSVVSAGLLEGGYASPREVITTMAEYGIDLSAHRSREVTAADVESADLVIVMERAHLRELGSLSPLALSRTLTMREAVRRAGEAGGRPAGASIGDWAAALTSTRRAAELAGLSRADDTPDPMGRKPAAYEAAAAELARLVGDVASLLWPAGR